MILLDLLVRAVIAAFLLAFVLGTIALLTTPPRRAPRQAARGPLEDLSRLDLMDAACGCEDGDCFWCAARTGADRLPSPTKPPYVRGIPQADRYPEETS